MMNQMMINEKEDFEERQRKAMAEVEQILVKYRLGINPVIQVVDLDRLPKTDKDLLAGY